MITAILNSLDILLFRSVIRGLEMSLISGDHKISEWTDKWLVTMNPVKSRNVVCSLKRNKQDHPPLLLDTKVVKDVECHTHLGLTLQSNMSRRNHIV